MTGDPATTPPTSDSVVPEDVQNARRTRGAPTSRREHRKTKAVSDSSLELSRKQVQAKTFNGDCGKPSAGVRQRERLKTSLLAGTGKRREESVVGGLIEFLLESFLSKTGSVNASRLFTEVARGTQELRRISDVAFGKKRDQMS